MNDTKISANRQKKIAVVANLSEKLGRSKAVVFTNYTGVTHKQLEALKRAIKPLEAEYVIAKNSLILRALDENKIKLEGENPLEGPTGTLLVYADFVAPLKQLAKTMKDLGLLNIKLGIMENKFLTGEQLLRISALPPRETLLAQVAAGLKSPISGLHRALSWNLQKLVMTLKAISDKKPATPAPVAAPAPVGPVTEPVQETPSTAPIPEPAPEAPAASEPETILAETPAEKKAEEKLSEAKSDSAKVKSLPEEGTEKSVASNAIDKGGEN